jgi:hypothetical protein
MGGFASGPDLDVTFSSQTTYTTADPTVATIDNLGRITGVATGRTTVAAGKTSAVVTALRQGHPSGPGVLCGPIGGIRGAN